MYGTRSVSTWLRIAANSCCAALLVVFIAGCGSSSSAPPPPPPPQFSLSASPSSLSVAQGASGTSTITATPQNGFTGTVALSASGLPSGVTATFNPPSTTGNSSLTLAASSGATTGTATVTITGSSGSLTTTTTLSLTVTATPAAATPVLFPVPGAYSQTQAGQMITLTDATAAATMYYTTDGSTPTTASTVYANPFPIMATTTIKAIATASGFSASAVASGTYTLTAPGTGPTVAVVVTTDDQTRKLASQNSVSFSAASGGSNPIYIDETEVYQPIEGFGASTTDTAMFDLYEIAKVKQPTQFTQAVSDLFTRQGNGIGLSFLRNPMGASDLARSVYSFDDNNGVADPTLASFSIAHDQTDIIPFLLLAKAANPQIKIMANPWSPPGWMKTSNNMIGGSLQPTMYDPFAQYFVKYIQAYKTAGITIDYISLQNEPLFVPTSYPGMCMPATSASTDCASSTDQQTALFSHVLPALTAANLSTKVLVYDHNWDRGDYPQNVLVANQASLNQIAGVAWHGYGGTPGVMTPLHNMFPTIGQYETEHSGFVTNSDQASIDFPEIIQNMRNWAKAFVKWSLSVDENQGPHSGGCGTCSPIALVNSTTGNITYSIEYYTLGHFSKYVLSGANRVYSSNAQGIVTAAFVNPDSSRVLVAYNISAATQTFEVLWGTQSFTYTLPALAAATFTWNGTLVAGTPAYTVSAKSQIQASSFNSTAGLNVPGNFQTWGLETELTTDTDGGYDVGFASDGNYAVYKNVDFGTGVTGVTARLACLQNPGNCGGTLEFHLDSAAGARIAAVTIPSTGGFQAWQTTPSVTVSGANGVHDLYVMFKAPASGTTALGNVNWFKFN
jgi:glucosylceramidase